MATAVTAAAEVHEGSASFYGRHRVLLSACVLWNRIVLEAAPQVDQGTRIRKLAATLRALAASPALLSLPLSRCDLPASSTTPARQPARRALLARVSWHASATSRDVTSAAHHAGIVVHLWPRATRSRG